MGADIIWTQNKGVQKFFTMDVYFVFNGGEINGIIVVCQLPRKFDWRKLSKALYLFSLTPSQCAAFWDSHPDQSDSSMQLWPIESCRYSASFRIGCILNYPHIQHSPGDQNGCEKFTAQCYTALIKLQHIVLSIKTHGNMWWLCSNRVQRAAPRISEEEKASSLNPKRVVLYHL